VLGIALPGGKAWTPQQEDDLATIVRTLSISLEREVLRHEQEASLIARESERLGRILLNTISHEMRTPLTAIQGAATSLLDEEGPADPALRSALLSEILNASVRLNNIVENLLSMNRLESGHLKLRSSTVDVEELLSVALAAVRSEAGSREVTVSGLVKGTAVSVDFVLMVQALAGILQNACRHTPDGTPVEVSVHGEGRDMTIQVRDWGPGVPEFELPHLFEKFFRGEGAQAGGTGLGLTISAGIVQAHGGDIGALLPEGGGLAIVLRIPGCVIEER
jgi:two-component system sensor histidine kinase KdpD